MFRFRDSDEYFLASAPNAKDISNSCFFCVKRKIYLLVRYGQAFSLYYHTQHLLSQTYDTGQDTVEGLYASCVSEAEPTSVFDNYWYKL